MPSTVIASIDYTPETEELRITFVSGIVYRYLKVPETVYQQLKNSRAKGISFNQLIKDKYTFEKEMG